MNEDPIIAKIRRYRAEHAERYGHNLGRICEALREVERSQAVKSCIVNPACWSRKPVANC